MRELLEVTVTCPECGGRVLVHLDVDGGPHLAGRCGPCGEETSVVLDTDPQPVGRRAMAAAGARS